MGNWMRVEIEGTCDPAEVPALMDACEMGADFHPLTNTGGLCGLGMWPATDIHAVGNLAERDYTPSAVAKALDRLAKVAPSLRVKVHCGADYEGNGCVATVTLADGEANVGAPEREKIPPLDNAKCTANLFAALFAQPRR